MYGSYTINHDVVGLSLHHPTSTPCPSPRVRTPRPNSCCQSDLAHVIVTSGQREKFLKKALTPKERKMPWRDYSKILQGDTWMRKQLRKVGIMHFPVVLCIPYQSRVGLLILEASYGAAETEEGVKDMLIDVTIPIQALVRNSQLYIRGGKDKVLLTN